MHSSLIYLPPEKPYLCPMLPKLPIGQQDFRKIRTSGALYVDKTQAIHRLVTEGDYYFLSRPRRFGKSLTLSVIKELFEGSRELFEGLWVEENWDWERRYPVIHFSFSSMGYKEVGLEAAIERALDRKAAEMGLELSGQGISYRFQDLLKKAAREMPVVLLIDEYDKPLIDYLDKDNLPTALAHQKILKSFYSIIKDNDANIHFLLITGVSKFSKVGVFSDLNNLRDITLSPAFSTLAGITQSELEAYFGDEMDLIAAEKEMLPATLRADIQRWYNGYSFDAKNFLYNPFSLLNFFGDRQFNNYWFASGTPTFLVKLLRERNVVQLDNIRLDAVAFNSYNLERLETYALLFQTGYLTIKSLDEFRIYTLGYPNLEVEESMMRHLFSEFRHEEVGASGPTVIDLRQALYANDLPPAIEVLDSVFQSIPHQLFLQKREAYFHSLVYLTFRLLGIYTQSEVNTARGRLDCVVQTPTHIYLFEFKLDQSAEAALEQIHSRGYADAYRQSSKEVVLVGVNFSSTHKAVEGWKAEQVE